MAPLKHHRVLLAFVYSIKYLISEETPFPTCYFFSIFTTQEPTLTFFRLPLLLAHFDPQTQTWVIKTQFCLLSFSHWYPFPIKPGTHLHVPLWLQYAWMWQCKQRSTEKGRSVIVHPLARYELFSRDFR